MGLRIESLCRSFFCVKVRCLISVLDSKIKELDSNGQIRKDQDILSVDNVERLLRFESLLKFYLKASKMRLIFNVAFITAFRTEKLSDIRIADVSLKLAEGKECIETVKRIGGCSGCPNDRQGGLKVVGLIP